MFAPSIQPSPTGDAMHEFCAGLYPICRSLTGNGVRETLARVAERIPLDLHEVPTGTRVLDWTIPREWNVQDAAVIDASGRRVIDFRESNLHLVGYSVPVRTTLSLAELRPHLHSLPEQPRVIPYRTSYYTESWGFCLRHDRLVTLAEGDYEVRIDTTLTDGSLTYGEWVLPGASTDEVLISCHICHPSLANDNLSGIAVATFLGAALARAPRALSYRILFVPGTIGSITWLARNEASLGNVRHGVVLTCVGDPGRPTYKKSRRGNAEVDRAFVHVLSRKGREHAIVDFSPWGYDERQYGSPGFDLPVGCLMRTPHGQFAEYHTSADDLDFIRPQALADSLAVCLDAFEILEGNRCYCNTAPKGEPQLGRRGLYDPVGGKPHPPGRQLALLWTLNLSDTRHSLLDIAERSGLDFAAIRAAADDLLRVGLLAPA